MKACTGSRLPQFRQLRMVAIHLLLIGLANYLAFWLRFDGMIPEWALRAFAQMLPLLVVIRLVSFAPFRLYEGMWRYTSVWDLRNIIVATCTSTVLFYFVTRWGFGLVTYPRSVYVVDTVLLIFFLGGTRLAVRISRIQGSVEQPKRLLIYGAGNAGESIIRDLINSPSFGYQPIGFMDDDMRKIGQRIHGVQVLGTRQSLNTIMVTMAPHAVLIAMPSMRPSTVREIVKALEPYNVLIKTVPHLANFLDGKVEVSQIRNLSIEDLLDRAPVGLDPVPIRKLVHGNRVMVTGAGGSIGSELCRQIASLQPSSLILYERYENSLHAIHTELLDCHQQDVFAVVGDVTDQARLETVMQAYAPQIIFHAAAHKHVPLMELSPCEAVKNNIGGTRTVAYAAHRQGVQRFIMISTDKAVNPTSIMGATKRVGELIVQDLASRSQTNFVIVRFGNVLGSNGSVVPRFLQQIQAGGPVTVTDPNVRRYFMLIPEAVQLVLHAAALGERGAVYVLDMGEQIKVVDLARHMIRLAGFVPEEDIPISFVGLRPGEKLYEELVGPDETVETSSVPKILQVRSQGPAAVEPLAERLALIEDMAFRGEGQAVVDDLCKLVPTFRPVTSPSWLTSCPDAGGTRRLHWVHRVPESVGGLTSEVRPLG
jgi:FlaA1/EpsC-like NDP-sugar epimerase